MSENNTQGLNEWAADHLIIGHVGATPAPASQGPRPLRVIAEEIRQDWSAQGRGVSPYAAPYLSAMAELDDVHGAYYADSAASVVRYFLANATTWRGETARRVKAELKTMIKGVY